MSRSSESFSRASFCYALRAALLCIPPPEWWKVKNQTIISFLGRNLLVYASNGPVTSWSRIESEKELTPMSIAVDGKRLLSSFEGCGDEDVRIEDGARLVLFSSGSIKSSFSHDFDSDDIGISVEPEPSVPGPTYSGDSARALLDAIVSCLPFATPEGEHLRSPDPSVVGKGVGYERVHLQVSPDPGGICEQSFAVEDTGGKALQGYADVPFDPILVFRRSWNYHFRAIFQNDSPYSV